MTEAARRERNVAKLNECYPTFRYRAARIIQQMEKRGFRPRIQTAARSPEDQLKAYNAGNSQLKYGFHNVTGPDGRPEALAVDILDDDAPLSPSNRYLIALAMEASLVGCKTGIRWGLPPTLQHTVDIAVMEGDLSYSGKIGWDPTHVEMSDLTVSGAKAGERPAPLE